MTRNIHDHRVQHLVWKPRRIAVQPQDEAAFLHAGLDAQAGARMVQGIVDGVDQSQFHQVLRRPGIDEDRAAMTQFLQQLLAITAVAQIEVTQDEIIVPGFTW